MSGTGVSYRFGSFELDSETGELRKSGIRLKLGGQPLDVLAILVQRKGRLVTREELKDALWQEETFTDFDHGVNTAVQRIRRALSDSAQTPRYIETLPRKGYRFIAPIEEIGGAGESESQPTPPTPDPKPKPWPWAALAGFAALIALGVYVSSPTAPPPAETVKFVLAPGKDVHDPKISPDGRYVAFVTREDGGALWIRDMSGTEPREIPNTKGARLPFWSPDSKFLGFGMDTGVWRMNVEGAPSLIQVSKSSDAYSSNYQGGAWSPDGQRIFLVDHPQTVAASGGQPQGASPNLTWEDGYEWEPHFLPLADRRVVLLQHMSPLDNRIFALDLDRDEKIEIGPGRAPVYSSTGHILYEDEGLESRIWAQPFSIDNLQTTGERFLVAEGAFSPSVSDDGTLVYIDGDSTSIERLVWHDRDGSNPQVVSGPLPEARFIDLSPDGKTVTFRAVVNGLQAIWTVDVTGSLDDAQRLSFGPVDSAENLPQWSPDGTRVAYSRFPEWDHLLKPVDGSDEATFWTGRGIISDLWADGSKELIVFHSRIGGPDGPMVVKHGELSPGKPLELETLPTSPDESLYGPKISPDGRYVAYVAADKGIVVRTFPKGDRSWMVSRPQDGPRAPQWSRAGDEIYYPSGDLLVAAKVSTDPEFKVEEHEELFRSEGFVGQAMPQYDIGPDGRVIVLEPAATRDPTLRVSQNWFAEFAE